MRKQKLVVMLLSCLSILTLTVVTFAQPRLDQLPEKALPPLEEMGGVRLISFPTQGSGYIVYELFEVTKVRIRISMKSNAQAVVRTLIDWEERPAGLNKEVWDGKDSAGNLIDLKNFMVTIKLKPSVQARKLNIQNILLTNNATLDGIAIITHYHCVPGKCGELNIKITSPTNQATLSGIVTVTVELRGKHRGYSDKVGSRLRVFLNYHPEYIKELSFEKTDTFSWQWDTTVVPNGEHILTVNVCDHHDHVGVDTIKVNIQN